MSGARAKRVMSQLNGLSWLNHPRNSGWQCGINRGDRYKTPAPGVPHIHLSEVETAKSISGALTSKGKSPAAWVISTPIKLPIRRPCATIWGRLIRCEVVEDTHVSSARPTSGVQSFRKSSSSTWAAPWRSATVFSVKPQLSAKPCSKKWFEGKQSAPTSTLRPLRCPAGKEVRSA